MLDFKLMYIANSLMYNSNIQKMELTKMEKFGPIVALLHKHQIKNYTIRPDGIVDVEGHINLSRQGFVNFPFKFGTVTGDFNCSMCENLSSLEGAPSFVGGDFDCCSCQRLTTLQHSPISVNAFDCYNCNNLTSLDGLSPNILRILDIRACAKITSFEGVKFRTAGVIRCSWPNITSGGISLILTGCSYLESNTGPFEIIDKYLGRHEDIFECQVALIEAGYPEFAKL